jgi:hypothetical protein
MFQHPTGKSPESVTLVALGPTKEEFVKNQTSHTPKIRADEVWTLNTGIRWLKHDLAFIMDDMSEFAHHFPVYGEEMRNADKPIITSAKYDEFPTAIDYPLQEVINEFKQVYFNNSVPYIIAYALYIGVKELNLFGADYTFPGQEARESGRGCVEFWIGFAASRGMRVNVVDQSTLMDACEDGRFYGYIHQPRISFDVVDINRELKPGSGTRFESVAQRR